MLLVEISSSNQSRSCLALLHSPLSLACMSNQAVNLKASLQLQARLSRLAPGCCPRGWHALRIPRSSYTLMEDMCFTACKGLIISMGM